jgi:hypothetical protein
MEKLLTRATLLILMQAPLTFILAKGTLASQRPGDDLAHPWDTYKLLLLGFLGFVLLAWLVYVWVVIRLENGISKSNTVDNSARNRNIQAMPHYSATEEYRPSALSSHLLAVKANRGSKPSDPSRTPQNNGRGNP